MKRFQCLGGDASLQGDTPGKQAHECIGAEHWHNAWAGPFCSKHLKEWEERNRRQYAEFGLTSKTE